MTLCLSLHILASLISMCNIILAPVNISFFIFIFFTLNPLSISSISPQYLSVITSETWFEAFVKEVHFDLTSPQQQGEGNCLRRHIISRFSNDHQQSRPNHWEQRGASHSQTSKESQTCTLFLHHWSWSKAANLRWFLGTSTSAHALQPEPVNNTPESQSWIYSFTVTSETTHSGELWDVSLRSNWKRLPGFGPKVIWGECSRKQGLL